MKAKIHPKYVECTATCACGATFKTRSTRETISVETCSQCHPFYTGREKLVDTAGRVERFRKKYDGVKPKKKKTVAQALAELGRCETAAKWQQKVVDAAVADGATDVLDILRADLEMYQRDRPCRPPGR